MVVTASRPSRTGSGFRLSGRGYDDSRCSDVAAARYTPGVNCTRRFVTFLLIALACVPAAAQESDFSALLRRAENGDAQAQFDVARAFQTGADGAERNIAHAISWYVRAAKAGRGDAMYNVAVIYYNGDTLGDQVPADVRVALKWFILSDAYGEKQAFASIQQVSTEVSSEGLAIVQRDAAEMMLLGAGVPQRTEQAIQLLEKSANGGNESAYARLADVHIKGDIVPQNLPKARAYCDAAANEDRGIGYFCQARFYDDMASVRDPRRARDLYQKAVGRGNLDAAYRLGQIYSDGTNELKPDKIKAVAYFYLASCRGHKAASMEGNTLIKTLTDKEKKKAAQEVAKLGGCHLLVKR